MASLVADYGTSSSSSESSESDSSELDDSIKEDCTESSPATKLPTPDFGEKPSKTSIFSNPFIEEENAKKAILEKHVKMVNSRENTKVLNGKKICWNYRKGRCRFGTKCTFAHDSDLQKSEAVLLDEMKIQQTVIFQNQPSQISVAASTNSKTNEESGPMRKKKRPSLTQGLVPGKRVMKNFKKLQTQLPVPSK